MSLSGKSAIILGGLGGIGSAICDKFLTLGIENLAVIDCVDPIVVLEKFTSINFVFKKVSVEDRAALKEAFEAVKVHFGGGIDLIVNCVGILDEIDYLKSIHVNLGGAMTSTLLGVDVMRKDRDGHGGQIIQIASIASYQPMLVIPAFTGAFFGILGFTRALAVEPFEALTGIKFAIICPGITKTNMYATSTAQAKLFPEFQDYYMEIIKGTETQDPESVAECVVHALTSPNGQVLECVGGVIRPIIEQ